MMMDAERRRRHNADMRRAEQWARINAASGFGSLASFVVVLILVGYSLVSR